MIIGIIYIGISKASNLLEENVWNNQSKINNDLTDNKTPDKDKNNEEQNNREESPLRLYQIGEEVTFGPYTYKVNSVTYGKKRGDFYAPVDYESYSFDENGDVLGDNSYVVVNVSIVNNEEETLELYLNSMKLIVLRDSETRVGDYCECVSASKLEEYGRKDFFRVEIEPAIEYDYDLVFIAPDSSIDNNEAQLGIERQGVYTASNNDDKYRCVDIKFR